MVMTRVDLMRHGEPVGGRRFRGSIDDPLSASGWEQMERQVAAATPWGRIISSPLQRCAAFAQTLSERTQLPLAYAEGLREISFGQWDGCEVAEIDRHQGDHLGRFWRDPINNPPPEGEPLEQFQARVVAAWEKIIVSHGGEHLLLIVHGGVIRLLIGYILGMPLDHFWRLEVPYAALSRIHIYGQGEEQRCTLIFHNGKLS